MNASFWNKPLSFPQTPKRHTNTHTQENAQTSLACQSLSALRRPPQSHLLPIIPWVQSSRPSAVWETDHSDSALSPQSGSQSIRSPPHKPTPGEVELTTSLPSLQPPTDSALRCSWIPMTFLLCMAPHYSHITIKFPSVSAILHYTCSAPLALPVSVCLLLSSAQKHIDLVSQVCYHERLKESKRGSLSSNGSYNGHRATEPLKLSQTDTHIRHVA